MAFSVMSLLCLLVNKTTWQGSLMNTGYARPFPYVTLKYKTSHITPKSYAPFIDAFLMQITANAKRQIYITHAAVVFLPSHVCATLSSAHIPYSQRLALSPSLLVALLLAALGKLQHALGYVGQTLQYLAHPASFQQAALHPLITLVCYCNSNLHGLDGRIFVQEPGSRLEDGEIGKNHVGDVGLE
jgi:hypothetical protein